MAQLSLSPWLAIYICSWTILIFLAPTKILNHLPINEPTSKSSEIKKSTWIWLW